jgi:S-DNA-T family DNA segregation ATPase FtsK/SpoIIIE
MRERLTFMADSIEAVLCSHHISSRVTGGTVTSRRIRFQVLPALGTEMFKIKGLGEELAAALDTPNCRVLRRGAAMDIEMPRSDPLPVRLLPLYRQLDEEGAGIIPPATAILGLAEDSTPLLIRLPSPDVAHILVTGTRGAGKTVLLQSMVLSLAMANSAPSPAVTSGGLALILVDLNGRAFGHFEELPHLARPVIREMDEAIEALQSLVRLMDRRVQAVQPGGEAHLGAEPRTIVAIDELAELMVAASDMVSPAMIRLTQHGRQAGIHVIAATREVAVLESLEKARFPARLVGRVTNAADARSATGWSGAGAERLLGRGDFLAVAEGRVVRFQSAHVSPEETAKVLSCLAQEKAGAVPATLPWLRGQVTPLFGQVQTEEEMR